LGTAVLAAFIAQLYEHRDEKRYFVPDDGPDRLKGLLASRTIRKDLSSAELDKATKK
jgi:hypothetical protein